MNIEEMIKRLIEENTTDKKREAIQAIRDLAVAYEKEKEKNKELSNSYDKLAKECNEENRRCMLLAVENQDLKEKNKELEKQLQSTYQKQYINDLEAMNHSNVSFN